MSFTIYVDRLKDGHTELITEDFDPKFLEVDEPDLQFSGPIHVEGEAYLADQHLVLCLKVKGTALMPCTICNQMIRVPVKVDKFYFSASIEEIPPVFAYQEHLREALLIELPHYVECREGNCPERKNITGYLKKKVVSEDTPSTYFPFSDLEK